MVGFYGILGLVVGGLFEVGLSVFFGRFWGRKWWVKGDVSAAFLGLFFVGFVAVWGCDLVGILDDIFGGFGRCFGFVSAGFSLVAWGCFDGGFQYC